MSIELLLMTAAGSIGTITYNQVRIAISPTGTETQRFGSAVAIRGDGGEVLWVGQRNATVGGTANVGKVWRYIESAANTSIYQTGGSNIDGPTVANTYFGYSIDASPTGNWVVVSGPGTVNNIINGPDGYVRLIQDPTPTAYGMTGTVRANLTPPTAGGYDFFGCAVSMDNTANTIIVGEAQNNGNDGRVLRYTGGNTTWTLSNTYVPTNTAGSPTLGIATSTNANGTYIVGGAILDESVGTSPVGAAYVFSTLQATQRLQETPSPISSNPDRMGYAVKISDDATTLAVSAPQSDFSGNGVGLIYVYKRVPPAATWTLVKTLTCPDASDSSIQPDDFGRYMDMNAAGTVIAASSDRGTTGNPITYIFKLVGGSWECTGRCLIDDYATAGLTLTPSVITDVSLNSLGNVLAVGHPTASVNFSMNGIVAVYKNI
jgi:hypothetical protein